MMQRVREEGGAGLDDKIKGLKVDARDQGEGREGEPFSHTKGRVLLHFKFIWASN